MNQADNRIDYEGLLFKRIKELEDRLEKIEQRDHVDWNNALSLGSTLGVTGNVTLGGSLTMNNGTLYNTSYDIRSSQFLYSVQSAMADDSVLATYPYLSAGIALVNIWGTTYNTAWGIADFRSSTTPHCNKIVGGTLFGVLTYTGTPPYSAATDTLLTVCASTDGRIYLINRLGGALNSAITFLGGATGL